MIGQPQPIGPFGLPKAEPSVETVIVISLPYESRETLAIRGELRTVIGRRRTGISIIQTQHDGSAEQRAVIIERGRAMMPFRGFAHGGGAQTFTPMLG